MNTIAKTERLLLREVIAEDWRDVFSYTGDEAVSRYQAWKPHLEQDAKEWLQLAVAAQKKTPRQMYYWAICLKPSGKLIGGMGIDILSVENANSAEVGYSLHRSYWHQGYGTEAVLAGLSYLFDQTSVRRIVAHCRESNLPSVRLLEKIGFRREGHFVEDVEVRGRLMNSFWYAMLRSEYLKRYSRI